ncbi:DUF3048 domain-containing protein [Siminovitchia sediminis]|uniref:DUF3048 domain-containing protein n=1 Tax=Siminovitchia sediminis TaxID=1274353 RepID=A0ABW4KPQ0_9BACI
MLRSAKWALVILSFFIFIASACSKDDAQQPQKKSKEHQTAEKIIAPLTGIETKVASLERAVAVTVNNHPDARPQTGLSQADIVYEMLAEGNVTRFLAIFQSEKPENTGPVRSARDYFIDLAKGYDALYVAHGHSPDAQQLLESGTVDHLNGIQHDGTLFQRVDFRQAPHNSYITFENIEKGAGDAGYQLDTAPAPLQFLDEQMAEDLEGEAASSIKVSYSPDPSYVAEYQYSSQDEKYSRSSAGSKTVEYGNEKPVLLDNIIVIEAPHTVKDSEGRRDIDLEAGGRALVFQRGIIQEAEWKNEGGRLLPYQNGEPMEWVAGKTWINIVPDLTNVSFE